MSRSYHPTESPLRGDRRNLKLKKQHQAAFRKPYPRFVNNLLDEFDMFLKHSPANLASVRVPHAASSTVSSETMVESARWTVWVSPAVQDRFHCLKKLSGAANHADFVDILLNVHTRNQAQASMHSQPAVRHRPRPKQAKLLPKNTGPANFLQVPIAGWSETFHQLPTQSTEAFNSRSAVPNGQPQVPPPESASVDVFCMSELATALTPEQSIASPHAPVVPMAHPTIPAESTVNVFAFTKKEMVLPLQQLGKDLFDPSGHICDLLPERTMSEQTLPKQTMSVSPSGPLTDVSQFNEVNRTDDYSNWLNYQAHIDLATLIVDKKLLQSLKDNMPDVHMDDSQPLKLQHVPTEPSGYIACDSVASTGTADILAYAFAPYDFPTPKLPPTTPDLPLTAFLFPNDSSSHDTLRSRPDTAQWLDYESTGISSPAMTSPGAHPENPFLSLNLPLYPVSLFDLVQTQSKSTHPPLSNDNVVLPPQSPFDFLECAPSWTNNGF
ncbi:uncharacterized protein BJ171DRAFT_182749 [Polychytrium aggregatum]|uniref:uncharacterized protein n=1 Tax=Polychytrium aggregatum TaxID=110093 RepID=UPI0022FDE646|nr:uncharacterized protein BJ171DRAFT_182749 [Polychytrium aggregatum]KAI9202299.1 hypothetical protein BJ171DRAFT_182749 [Polychytrium aggregatum]